MTSTRTDSIAAGPGPIVKDLAARCAAAGLDLCATCAAADYQRAVDPLYRLPDHGRARALVVLIGNTRALWPIVRAARAAGALAGPNPIDRHVEATVRAATAAAVAAHAPGTAAELRFSPEPPPRRVAMQKLAAVCGLAWQSPSHLSVHPAYGPWIALRAAIVLDVDGPPPRPPMAPPCDCEQHCLPRLREALAAGAPTSSAELRPRWRTWLAVRDACPVGRAHRYDEDQLRYHYTGDVTALDGS